MKYREIGLRMTQPAGIGPFSADRLKAVLFDIETGEPLNMAWKPSFIAVSPDEALAVTGTFFPSKVEFIQEKPE